MSDHVFRRSGLGYVLELPSIFTTFNLDRIHRSRDGLHGDLTVKTAWPGIKTFNGMMLAISFNITSGTLRKSVAKSLEDRAPVKDPSDQLDWYGFLEELCQGTMMAEREGGDIEEIGEREDIARPLPLIRPLSDRKQATIVYGDSGTGKSMFVIGAAVSVRTGLEIVPGLLPAEPTKVLYLDYETSADEMDRRLKAICAGAGIPRTTLYYKRCYSPLHEMVEQLARQVAENQIGLVIVDPIGYAMGFSRDGGDPAEPALRFFGALRMLDSTTICVDHVGKVKDSMNGNAKPYGSSYKSHAARATWEFQEARKYDTEAHVALYHRKHNNTRPYPAMGFAMKASDTEVTWRSEEIYDAELAEAMSNADRISFAMQQHPLRVREISNQTGLPEATVRGELNRLRGVKFEKIETGDWSVISGGKQG